jgi:hypothetical protein
MEDVPDFTKQRIFSDVSDEHFLGIHKIAFRLKKNIFILADLFLHRRERDAQLKFGFNFKVLI